MSEQDPVRDMMPVSAFEHMARRLPALDGPHFIPGAGHFVMQEAPGPVNAAILPFLARHR